MSCSKCSSEIFDSQSVRYSCGHCYHIGCILKSKMSIRNPICPACDQGSLIYVRDDNTIHHDNTNAIRERGPHLIHYIIAFIILVSSIYLLFIIE